MIFPSPQSIRQQAIQAHYRAEIMSEKYGDNAVVLSNHCRSGYLLQIKPWMLRGLARVLFAVAE